MNIFVTVGTTPFRSLFDAIAERQQPEWTLTFQTAEPGLSYQGIECFDFTSDFDVLVDRADVVISHAGAGSVYGFLEKGKKLIVVPNLERIDKHQTDLARYVSDKGFALTCFALNDVGRLLNEVSHFTPHPYSKTDFFIAEQIANRIQELTRPRD